MQNFELDYPHCIPAGLTQALCAAGISESLTDDYQPLLTTAERHGRISPGPTGCQWDSPVPRIKH